MSIVDLDFFLFFVLHAVPAGSVEECGVGIDLPVKMFVGDLIDLVHMCIRKLQIENLAAGSAYNVIMRIGASVEAVAAVWRGDLHCLPHICQQIQVAIYGSKTDAWKFFSYMEIYGIGSRVIHSAHQILFNRSALTTVFQ